MAGFGPPFFISVSGFVPGQWGLSRYPRGTWKPLRIGHLSENTRFLVPHASGTWEPLTAFGLGNQLARKRRFSENFCFTAFEPKYFNFKDLFPRPGKRGGKGPRKAGVKQSGKHARRTQCRLAKNVRNAKFVRKTFCISS